MNDFSVQIMQWSTIEFVVKQYKEFKDVYVLGGVDDVLSALEDSMVTMNTVTSSRFVFMTWDSQFLYKAFYLQLIETTGRPMIIKTTVFVCF